MNSYFQEFAGFIYSGPLQGYWANSDTPFMLAGELRDDALVNTVAHRYDNTYGVWVLCI